MLVHRTVGLGVCATMVALLGVVSCGGGDDAAAPGQDAGGGDSTVPGNDSGADGTTPPGDTGADTSDAGKTGPDATVDSGDASDGGNADANDGAIADTGRDVAPIPCSDASPCEAGACCSGACVDPTRDPTNCGACGVSCTTAQFCNGTGCLGL